MSVLQNRPKGARFASFGFALLIFGLLPNQTGFQDLASLLARQPGVAERWQKGILGSPFASIQIATFSFPRPIGTSMPQAADIRLASFENHTSDVTGSLGRNPLGQVIRRPQASEFPTVNRSLKGDRLTVRAPGSAVPADETMHGAPEAAGIAPSMTDEVTQPVVSMPAAIDAMPSPASPVVIPVTKPPKTAELSEPLDPELEAALKDAPLAQYDISLSLESDPLGDLKEQELRDELPTKDNFAVQTARLYFGGASLGVTSGSIERWQPGEEPTLMLPGNGIDPDMKQSSTLPADGLTPAQEGSSVAGKGEVTGEKQRPKSPAQRLGLEGKARDKAEKCLANAVYFEARGEAVRGQMAVAQVVMNRVFSGFYPNNVCGVVYQNSHRHLACQFTFACDNVADVVREPDMWDRAARIAKATLDGRLWLPEVAKSTHYHAYWVHPSWVHEMKKMYKFGVHTFYRPRNWGDGSDAPSWGTAAETAEISARLAALKE